MSKTLQPWIAIGASLIAAVVIAWAGNHGSRLAFGVPLFGLCAALSFLVNWIAFVPAYARQTEHYYDATGSFTYVVLIVCASTFAGAPDARAGLLAGLVLIWALRLGSFLFARIRRDGSDGRFDALKPDLPRFLMTWTLQGLWVFITLACALAAITSTHRAPLGPIEALGAALWGVGFAIEVVADGQKRSFRADPENAGRFIATGLWAWSRHPNYFGEILLWIGIALISLPVLVGWQFATLISPVFVWFLLTRISGVPLLESRGKKRWGIEPAYQEYKRRTPVLVPRPPRIS